MGIVYSHLGQYQRAIELLEQDLAIARELDNRSGEGRALGNLGIVYSDLGQYQRAIELLEQHLTISRDMADLTGESAALGNLGTVYSHLDQYPRAIELHEQQLAIARDLNDRVGEGAALGNLGIVYDNLGQYQRAIELYQQALAIARDLGNRVGEGTSLLHLGSVHNNLGQYQQAIELHEQALAISRELGERAREGVALDALGSVHNNLGQYQRAIELHEQSLAISRELGNRAGEGATLGNLGSVHNNLGQYQRAIELYQQALAISRELGNRTGEGAALDALGSVYSDLGQYQRAIELYQQALVIAQDLEVRGREGTTLGNLGGVYYKLSQYHQAIELFNQSLAISRELGDRAGEGATLGNLGAAYTDLDQYQQAIELHEQSLAISRELGDRAGEGATLGNLGAAYTDLAQYQQAIELYKQSIEVRESIQATITVDELRGSFADEQISIYARLINLLWDQGEPEAAFLYAERAKAKVFLDQLATGQIDFRAGVASNLLTQEQQLKVEITGLRTQLLTLRNRPQNEWDTTLVREIQQQLSNKEQDYEFLLTRLKSQSPATSAMVSVDVAPLEDIQAQLDPNTTLLEFFVTNSRILVFLITLDEFRTITLDVSSDELVEEIVLFRDFSDVSEGHPGEIQQLYKWLIAPIQSELKTDNLVIVPHNILHYVPFAALSDGSNYLIDQYSLSTLPSANALRFLPDKSNQPFQQILALGNPTIEASLSSLEHSQDEVEAITKLFKSKVYVGQEASETLVREQGPQSSLLHLAVHGESNPINPLFSTLHLAKDSQNDGRLELHEVFGLDLTGPTQLVVLSACQTQVGELSRGDEIVGLNRAFLYAGTPAVMASLWNIDDEATALLMETFYKHLQEGIPMTRALQLAQQKISQMPEYAHPYFWAAFSLTSGKP